MPNTQPGQGASPRLRKKKNMKWGWKGEFACRDVGAGGEQGSTDLEEALGQGGEPTAELEVPAEPGRKVCSRVGRLGTKIRVRN